VLPKVTGKQNENENKDGKHPRNVKYRLKNVMVFIH
jgi:hypothetical protein